MVVIKLANENKYVKSFYLSQTYDDIQYTEDIKEAIHFKHKRYAINSWPNVEVSHKIVEVE